MSQLMPPYCFDPQNWSAVENRLGAGLVRWFSSRSYALYSCHGSVVKTMLHHGLFARPVIVSSMVFVFVQW